MNNFNEKKYKKNSFENVFLDEWTMAKVMMWDKYRYDTASVVDLHWFQCKSGSSILGQCGSRVLINKILKNKYS